MRRKQLTLALALAMASATGTVYAGPFELENGMDGRWGLDLSLGNSWRTRDADRALIGKQNGGQAPSSSTDDGNLNFPKHGDTFSTIAKAIGEIKLQKDGFGVFARAKGWYDHTLARRGVPFGSIANGYAAGHPLEDSHFDPLSKFSGLALLDAYAFGSFRLGEEARLSLNAGRHAVNWGESLFISGGVNQYNPVDVAAARRPGAQLKEIILPSRQVSANLGIAGASVEAFYKLKTQKTVLEGCGTYWSPSDVLNCNDPNFEFTNISPATPDNIALNGFAGGLKLTGENRYPRDGGSYGLALHKLVADVDVGAYIVNYTTTTPRVSIGNMPSSAGGFFQKTVPLSVFWDWSANNIRVYGLSGATEMGGWSLFGEVSHTRDFPAQINGADLVGGYGIQNGGILAQAKGAPFRTLVPAGGLLHGYDLKNKTQIQLSTIKSFSTIAGAESLSLVGEVAYQRWSGIGDPRTSTRYGRDFSFGIASWAANGASFNCVSNGSAPSTAGCAADGYATPYAWGYRLQATLSYPNALAGVNLTPRLFWSQDVRGYSADGVFLQDRKVLGIAMRAEYLKKYYADIGYTSYNHHAGYDVLRDRDFLSVVVGMSF